MKINFIISKVYNSVFGYDGDLILYKSNFEQFSSKSLNKIVDYIEKETKMKFKKKEYDCFLVGKFPVKGISSPLTVRISDNIDLDFTTLIHELIHIILTENKIKADKVISKLCFENNLDINKDKKEVVHIFINDLLDKIKKI